MQYPGRERGYARRSSGDRGATLSVIAVAMLLENLENVGELLAAFRLHPQISFRRSSHPLGRINAQTTRCSASYLAPPRCHQPGGKSNARMGYIRAAPTR